MAVEKQRYSLQRQSSFSGGEGMEARLAKVEAAVEQIQADISTIKIDLREMRNHAREDFRVLFGALIIAALGLAGVLAKGFHWL